MPQEETHNISDSRTVGLADFLEVVVKRRRMIILVTATAFLAAVVYSLIATKIYRATTKILPPHEQQEIMTALMGQMGGMANLAGNFFGGSSQSDLYVGILQTDPVSEAVVSRFKLMEVYKTEFRSDAYRTLQKNSLVEADRKNGIISISIDDRDPKRAADIANALVEELEKSLLALKHADTSQNLRFFEERLARAKADLNRVEEELKRFQAKNKVLNVTEQAKVTIEGIAQLRAQQAAQEVQLVALRGQFTDSSQEVRGALATLAGLRRQIAALEGSGGGSALPTVGVVPALGQEYLRLMRELKTQETLVELLTKHYELNKLGETRSDVNIQIIQKATPPDKRIKPKRTKTVVVATFGALFLSIVAGFGAEALSRMSDADRQRWGTLLRSLISLK